MMPYVHCTVRLCSTLVPGTFFCTTPVRVPSEPRGWRTLQTPDRSENSHLDINAHPAPTRPASTNLHNSFVGFRVARRFKRWVADQALVAENPDAPQVHLLTVGVAFNHLWRQVVQGPAHCTTPGWVQNKEMRRASKERRDTAASGRVTQSRVAPDIMLLQFFTLEMVHGRTNQNLQSLAPRDSPTADSLAWCLDESLSSHGNTLVHQISPPCTGNIKGGGHWTTQIFSKQNWR